MGDIIIYIGLPLRSKNFAFILVLQYSGVARGGQGSIASNSKQVELLKFHFI